MGNVTTLSAATNPEVREIDDIWARWGNPGKIDRILKCNGGDLDEDFALLPRTALWHGTHINNLKAIVENGLEIPTNSNAFDTYGYAVYLTDYIGKALSYATAGAKGLRVVLLCEVALGSIFETQAETMPSLRAAPSGKDSLVFGKKRGITFLPVAHLQVPVEFTRGQERIFAVYDPRRVKVRYAIIFS
ncbi:poly(ADP-ribose) polymerase pme-2 [Selaginella moellendorffii]|uniref:poly(ADP-ribose) polymerase pme-2 n=1 Tax=Selaginella moellendorffii TaxID=88036 RepID=UPI000D1C8835|nr:poly(ADP-ribose) polymerase pme-2 [Selaginella moellendorffii]|eukprot:XP_024535907.1 poly(ADP-ribose) polymerase pme-2 [Selaginella moellendorffii]